MEKKSMWLRVFPVFIAVILAPLFIYQLIAFNINKVVTETVVEKTEQETLSIRAFAVRDEQYIIKETSGTIVPLVDDGKKVAKGDTVAVVCQSAKDALFFTEMKELQNNLYRYEQLNKQQNISNLDVDKLNSDADLIFIQMLNVVAAGKLEELDSGAAAFRNKLTSRQIAIDGRIDFSNKIKLLKNKLSELKNEVVYSQNLIAGKAGYYISSTDGYENKLHFKNIENLSASDIKQAINSKPSAVPTEALGKLVCNYNWYIATSIKKSDATQFKVGQTVRMKYGKSFNNTISVKVHSINSSQDGNTALVFICNLMNRQLASMRIADARIILKEYRGYKVNSAAIRVVGENTGAYVILGGVPIFRKCEVIYSNKEYVIAEIVKNTSDTKGPYNIELYDEVAIKGMNLDERKIID